eukprot:747154-Hanusia_phi.AAC.2
MYVVKRNGKSERVQFDKITSRISKLSYGLNLNFVEPLLIAQKCVNGVYSGVKTSELDTLAAETAAYLTTEHPDYSILAARIAVSNLHKQTKKVFSEVMTDCYSYVDQSSGRKSQLIADDVYEIIMANKDQFDSAIIYDRDYNYDYFGFKVLTRECIDSVLILNLQTLERSYLLKLNGQVAERPQHMLMRVAIGIHKQDIAGAIETYEYMSQKFFTHAR